MQISRSVLCSFALGATIVLSSCSFFRAHKDKSEDDSQGASAAKVDERKARYDLDIQAPRALKRLLADNLDLARFRDAPSAQAPTGEELDRLVALAPEQARALLATEGYFNAQVEVARQPPAAEGQRPVVRVTVQPGPRTVVDTLGLNVQGELQQRAQRGDSQARALLERVREEWPLKPGDPFRQAGWASAKNGALGLLHAEGYPSATLLDSDAAIRAREQRADLQASLQSGPLFHFGDMRIEGLTRYDERAVRNVAPFYAGMAYSEQQLQDLQDRLVRAGLFEGAVAEIDPDPAKAAAAPVTVRVKEQPLQKAILGLGYSTDTGGRITLEHTHRKPFGLRWTALNTFEFGPQRKAWEWDLRSYPQPGFQRNLVAGSVERWSGPDEERYAGRLRVGRAWEDPRMERQVYAEYNNTRVRTPTAAETRAQSLTANVDFNRRRVDSLLLPTKGSALLLQGAVGYARSSTADNGPLARAYGRLLVFKPLPKDWHATLRLEAGQVFARDAVGVPDTLLFRAGGQDSVRGYEYRGLGPKVNGVVTSGRALLTASAEIAHPLSPKLPQLWGAAFIDAGNAARRFGDLHPVVGAGVGVRYRSPIGPLKVDVAYGVDDRRVRLHLSAGVSF
jgi:translocation and assembly module TamA